MSERPDHAEAAAQGAPGSEQARRGGCTCAIMDNHYGRGYHGQPGVYVMSGDCPLHGER